VFRDNLLRHNTYGVKGDGQGVGLATLSAYFSRLLFDRNVLAGGPASKYPSGNYFPSVDEFLAAFTNPAGDDYSLIPGTTFTASASDGGAIGADIAKVKAATLGLLSGSSASATPGGSPDDDPQFATCRVGTTCSTVVELHPH
jgi:hypothetical protein